MMKQILICSITMLMWCLTAMATTPSGVGSVAASPFKVNAENAKTGIVPTNLISCRDMTPQWQKEWLAGKGIMVKRSGLPEPAEGRINPVKSLMRENEAIYTLTVNLNYDKDEVMMFAQGTAFPNYESSYWFFNEPPEEELPDAVEFLLPAGSYDIEVQLATKVGGDIILLAPETVMDSDRQITLDAADATVEVNWTSLLPDGEKAQGLIIECDAETGEIVGKTTGNCKSVTNYLYVKNTKHNVESLVLGEESTMKTGDTETTLGTHNVRIMPSNDYMMVRRTYAIGTEGGYIMVSMSDALQSADVSNNPEHYKVIKTEFAYTPYQPEPIVTGEGDNQVVAEFDKENAFFLQSYIIEDGCLTATSGEGYSGIVYTHMWIHVCQDPANIDKYQVMPVPAVVEDRDYRNTCLPIDTESATPNAVAKNNTDDYSPYLMLPEGRSAYINNIKNPWLSFDIEKPHVWNYGCPTQVFSTVNARWGASFSSSYIGRLGEHRVIDNLVTAATVSVNDEAPSEEVLENLQYGQLPAEGKINFEFTNPNVIIDDIPGKNVSRIEFDMARDDWQPPTLQIVRFTDTDGNFIDRYAKGEDGVMEFYGGDFTYCEEYSPYSSWYTETPAVEVSVEYAPYCTENFAPLEVENIPERDFMPGFGTYYRGSLADVDVASENGWFDVRIKLTDASGNYQEQTLSPAFWIEENVGVGEIVGNAVSMALSDGKITVSGCENPMIEVYSADGMSVCRVSGISADVTSLESGIYVVSVSDGESRVVRKVRI